MPIALNGWHPGEQVIRSKLGPELTSGYISQAYTWIDASMPDQHRIFHSRNLPFIPLTVKDARGRPWATLVAGPRNGYSETLNGQGRKGFGWVQSPSETELVMDLEMWDGDPMLECLGQFGSMERSSKVRDERLLVAGLGIEFPTRRRNKFAGWIECIEKKGPMSSRVHMQVNQAIGNCPKYINVRTLDLYPNNSPQVVHRNIDMASEDRLPEQIIEFIHQADTVFFATSYEAKESDKECFPSHVGMNARSGRPGMLRVRPSDGRTLVLPDYSGNRILTSLGNVEASSRAGMSFLDFEGGSILYITGTAKNLVGMDAQALMPRQNVLTTLYAEAFIFIRDALPVRQRPGTDVERSPYSPPVKFLAEEKEMRGSQVMDDVLVTLTRIDFLSSTLATFTFETDKQVKIRPGQAAALDFTDLLGAQEYAHMAPGNETRLNDDRVRTWTVSSWVPGILPSNADDGLGETRKFSLTMREKPGGLVTGALFNIARHVRLKMPDALIDTRRLGLRVRLSGITGSFTLPSEPNQSVEGLKMMWIAGGIGITPFISMLSYISSSKADTKYDVVLMLSTREPKILLRLMSDTLASHNLQAGPELKLCIHVFTTSKNFLAEDGFTKLGSGVSVAVHEGRPKVSEDDREILSMVPDVQERRIYLCGPPKFEVAWIDGLELAGVSRAAVMREGFEY